MKKILGTAICGLLLISEVAILLISAVFIGASEIILIIRDKIGEILEGRRLK